MCSRGLRNTTRKNGQLKLHEKFQSKYEWMDHSVIYVHTELEPEQKLVQRDEKKRNRHE